MKLSYLNVELDNLWNKKHGPNFGASVKSDIEKAHSLLLAKFKSDEVCFYNWPVEVTDQYLDSMELLALKIRENFDGALLFGIGGSHLGPSAIISALSQESGDSFKIYWLSNIDAPAIRRVEKIVSKHNLSAVVTSKSGSTIETVTSFFHLSDRLDPKGYVFITDPKVGELRRLGSLHQWNMIDIPPGIGGRYSVLTAVGLFPALLAGLDARGLIKGAIEMRGMLKELSPHENPAYQLAMAKYLWDTKHGCNVQYLMPYEQRLKQLSDWYVQLFAESLGKIDSQGKAVGFTPASALGTTDQHSLLQLFKQGPRDKVIGFIDVLASGEQVAIRSPKFEVQGQGNIKGHHFDEITSLASMAVEKSLSNSQVPTYRLQFPKVDEASLGAFFFFLEVSCAFAGELYGVDAYNQPGVEEAKTLLREAL